MSKPDMTEPGWTQVEPADGGWHRGDWMQTYTGGRFYPLDPTPEQVNPIDIAHALSMLCRYNGHIDRFYSVAEHCVLMSEWIERVTGDQTLALEGLLHDGSEAYCGDMVRPLKHSGVMADYIRAEDDVMVAIAKRFGLNLSYPSGWVGIGPATHSKSPIVKEADTRILLTERMALMSNYKPSDRWKADDLQALPVIIQAWSPAEAERAYLERLTLLGAL